MTGSACSVNSVLQRCSNRTLDASRPPKKPKTRWRDLVSIPDPCDGKQRLRRHPRCLHRSSVLREPIVAAVVVVVVNVVVLSIVSCSVKSTDVESYCVVGRCVHFRSFVLEFCVVAPAVVVL